jgi:tRNA(Arg) A34 adenosine deaminase TadA
MSDREHLEQAVALATENAGRGQLPFGAIVVRDGEVLGRGVNTTLRDHDPSAHAEVEAVRDACRTHGVLDLTGAVIYTSCEPCPMCNSTAVLAGITSLVYAAPKELAAAHGLTLEGLGARMQETWQAQDPGGVRAGDVDAAEAPFLRFDEVGRP